MTKKNSPKKYKKKTIPKALRENVWTKYVGKRFESPCWVSWCKNRITVFDFHVGHDIPESKGGKTDIGNLRPICSRCNHSMGSNYSIKEWNDTFKEKREGNCGVCNIM